MKTKNNQFAVVTRRGVSRVCRLLGYSTNHCNMVLNGKRESFPFLLLLDRHFPDLLETATFDAKAVVKDVKKKYIFDETKGKYGRFVLRESFDNRFAKAED